MADVKSLEHPTLKVPYEILNKKFRSGQKNIDREVSHVQQASTEVEQCLQDKKSPSVQQVSFALDSMVEKLCLLKRKDFLQMHCISTHYCFQIMKCVGENPCSYCTMNPARLPDDVLSGLSFLPCPVPDDSGVHYKTFQEVYEKTVDDSHCPSSKQNSDFSEEAQNADKQNRDTLKTQRARDIIPCGECGKPRLLFSPSKLTHEQAEESINEELEAAKVIKRRVEHLKEAECLQPHTRPLWQKKRLDRMLVEYFLRSGYYNTAIMLAQHSDIQDLTNIDLFLTSREVEESLVRREISHCLAWCYDNKSKLRKNKSTLEFKLRQQEFIELVRQDKRLEAVRHARRYFVNLVDQQLSDVQRVMGLLAYPANTILQPYKELYDEGRWHELVDQFREENFKLHQLNNSSVFTLTLQAGLSALKTPHCYREERNRNADCPVCSANLNKLGQRLPYAHCANSKLICSISGLPLNENNPPMALPNGHVYGYNSLSDLARLNDGRVVCPRTREIFQLDEAEKVFVM